MAYSWQQGVWPINPGDEISYKHWEDIRRYAFIKLFRNLSAYDYTDYITQATWAAWCDDNFVEFDPGKEFPLDFKEPGFQRLFNIVFWDPINNRADLFSCHYDGVFSMDSLKASAPFISGVFNSSKWKYAADTSRYRDFDRNSGRWIVTNYNAGSGTDTTYLSVSEAYKYLPKQVSPADQNQLIKYMDTQRVMPHVQSTPEGAINSCELNWQYMTQPSTLGPNYQIEAAKTPAPANVLYERKVPFTGDPDFVPMDGYDYAMFNGEPGQGGSGAPADALPADWFEENQMLFDPKCDFALQNQIERILSFYGWEVEIDPATEWGAEYINNYNLRNYGIVPSWPNFRLVDYTAYSTYDGGIWRIGSESPSGPPSYALSWERVDYGHKFKNSEPTHVSASDELWGCNRSGFELALWMIGSYDWYYTSAYIFWCQLHRLQRYGEETLADPPTPEELEASWPSPKGTWHMTHRCTFDRPKGASKMMPGELTPDGEVYADVSVDRPYWWSGIFVYDDTEPGDESTYLTAAQIAGLEARHGSLTASGRQKYEISAAMMNDLWYLLEAINLSFVECDMLKYIKQFHDQDPQEFYTSPLAYAHAIEDIFNEFETNPDAGDYTKYALAYTANTMAIGCTIDLSRDDDGPPDYTKTWLTSGIIYDGFICLYIDGSDVPIDFIQRQNIMVKMLVQPGLYSNAYEGSAIFIPKTLKLKVGQLTLEVPSFDVTYLKNSRPSTGVPDTMPDAYYDWGGAYPMENILGGIRGKVIYFPVDLSKATIVDEKIFIPVSWEMDVGTIEAYSPATYLACIISARANITQATNYIGFAYNKTGEVDIDMTERHVTYTEIAVDDEKFDDNGVLKG